MRTGTRLTPNRQSTVSADVSPPTGPNRLLATRRLAPADAIDRPLVTVNLAESPLGWLVRRGILSAAQFEAGERLRADFTRACLAPRVTMRWDAAPAARHARGPGGATAGETEGQIAARQRFDAAIAAAGPGLADVLWRVVCAGDGLETAEKALGWPARAGKLVLGIALDRLAIHYRIA